MKCRRQNIQNRAQAAQLQQVRVITETRNLKTTPFIPGDDIITTEKRWEEWFEEIEREFRYFKITDPTDKKDVLILGKEINREIGEKFAKP